MLEKIGYGLLTVVAVAYIAAMIAGMIIAWPWGLLGLIGILGLVFLLLKVIKDRLGNKDDDHYSKNVQL